MGSMLCPDRKSVAKELGIVGEDWEKFTLAYRKGKMKEHPELPKTAFFKFKKASRTIKKS